MPGPETLIYWITNIIAIVAFLIGAGAVLAPKRASGGYGVQIDGPAIAFVRATGVRDIFMAGAFFLLAQSHAWRGIGWLCLLGTFVAMIDAHGAFHQGRSRLWMVHASGAVVFVAFAVALFSSQTFSI